MNANALDRMHPNNRKAVMELHQAIEAGMARLDEVNVRLHWLYREAFPVTKEEIAK